MASETTDSQQARRAFGDFQTPIELALEVCLASKRHLDPPKTIIEPSCGLGSFIEAALEVFPTDEGTKIVGIDINADYLAHASHLVSAKSNGAELRFIHSDLFSVDWAEFLKNLPEPILFLGNPPWVTNSELGSMDRTNLANLPPKSNVHGDKGLDALTGRSNFDISEWMVIRMIEALADRCGAVAMLIKNSVARKVLSYTWRNKLPVQMVGLFSFDAAHFFHISADACLFLGHFGSGRPRRRCSIYSGLDQERYETTIGMVDKTLLSNIEVYNRRSHLFSSSKQGWRSGVKHDCAPVLELRRIDDQLVNGLGEQVDVEPEVLFPLMKGSDVSRGASKSRYLLLPQRRLGEDTRVLREVAPKAWRYLCFHGDRLDRRRSSIYRGRPRFSVFGVGDYTFALWKVAIAGLYKKLRFHPIGPEDGKPILFDDTVYFLPCENEADALHKAELLRSEAARDFLSSQIFWDAKRPITLGVLERLDLGQLNLES